MSQPDHARITVVLTQRRCLSLSSLSVIRNNCSGSLATCLYLSVPAHVATTSNTYVQARPVES